MVFAASWLALPNIDARAEPRENETVFEKPAEAQLPLISRSKKDKCEEYAALTGSNPFFCTKYMNERLLEMLLLSARKDAREPGPFPEHDR